MRISTVEPVDAFPPLAWCARVRRGDPAVVLRCGRGVEMFDGRAFFEGAWAGDFAAADFDRASDVFGSGGAVDQERDVLTFVTPSHTCERLQLVRDGDAIVISNSLCLLLAAAGARLCKTYAGYARDFTRIVYGIDHAVTSIPTDDGRRVELVYFRNVEVDAEWNVTYREKPPAQSFDDFAGYERLLTETLARVAANASDPARSLGRYELLTSVSTGYDSPACAALAKRLGARRAVTLTRARGPRGADDAESDSGAVVARAMGLDVTERDRLHYRLMEHTCPEAEFLATGMSGEDVNMLALEDQLAGTVFLTGFHGDKVWDRNEPANDVLKRGDLSGASMNEFRLRVNFVHVPVPFIGGLQHSTLRVIANSPEMRPWSVGGDYDRPVPRRLAEEAGAPREAFGQTKKATTALLHLQGPAAMSPTSRREIEQFFAQSRVPWSARLAFRADATADRSIRFLARALRKARFLGLVPPLRRKRLAVHAHTPLGPLPFIWAVERIGRERYQSADVPAPEPQTAAPMPVAT